ncbi:unnamed protein product [Staurois parvus]|uniref:Uncharacterized protein n=1 Tax=Staurois parvus TaxID=386267 RepID=A0ABN9B709_9NEOB|nr:unnamed protein product [Staurois parvus]
METAAMGGRTGTHERLWTGSSDEVAVYGAHGRLGAPGSRYGRPVICQHPMSKNSNTPAV